jgi:hypothetical protein
MAGERESDSTLNQDTFWSLGEPAEAALQRELDGGRSESTGEARRPSPDSWSIWDPPFDISCLVRSL